MLRAAGQGDHPGGGGAQHRGQQAGGERPVAEVVDAELGLEAVGGAPLRHRHHAGVVDQQVDRRVRGEDGIGGTLDRSQVAEIQLDDLDRGAGVGGE
jgi:hypothetical protein